MTAGRGVVRKGYVVGRCSCCLKCGKGREGLVAYESDDDDG